MGAITDNSQRHARDQVLQPLNQRSFIREPDPESIILAILHAVQCPQLPVKENDASKKLLLHPVNDSRDLDYSVLLATAHQDLSMMTTGELFTELFTELFAAGFVQWHKQSRTKSPKHPVSYDDTPAYNSRARSSISSWSGPAT